MNKRILLADDVELFIELEKTFFRRESFDLLIARTGRQAVNLAEETPPDLVFMDLYMPEMNGDEACRIIKSNPALKGIPVVMVTHGGREEDLQRCRDAGCDDIVLKPINRHHFLATARRHLGISDRTGPRVTARLRIQYGTEQREILTEYSLNLSTGGVFLETRNILDVDTPLQLEFILPGQNAPIRCRGRVAWINDPEKILKPHFPPGMGLQFTDLTLEDLEKVREFVKKECLSPSW